MRHERLAVRRDVFVDRRKLGVIGENVFAVAIFDFHPDVLPNLHCQGAGSKVAIDLLDGILGEGRAVEFIRVERRAQRHVPATRLHQRQRVIDLWLQPLAMRVCVVHDENVEQPQVQVFKHSLKRWIGFEDMHMNVDGMHGRERLERLGLNARARRSRRLREGRSQPESRAHQEENQFL